ncbi:MAG: hypothetical protein ACTTKZ_01765 [Bacteroides sp.]
MSGFLIWILATVIGVLITYNNKKKKEAALRDRKAEEDTSTLRSTEQVSLAAKLAARLRSGLENKELETLLGHYEETNTKPCEAYVEETAEEFSPELGGYDTTTPEWVMQEEYTDQEEIENEGISALSDRLYNEREMTTTLHTQESTPVLFPDGRPFDLRTAMVYDILLHRRGQEFLRARRLVH